MSPPQKEVLKRDAELSFPHCTVLKASAGSGKTHALTKRFVQFLLSERISHNNLRNILAITFSNNAAKEMKERVLQWLKALSLGDRERTEEMANIVAVQQADLSKKALTLVEEILDNYSDFQIKTIDSFMTSIFKASAIDFGMDPEFDILFDGSDIFEYTMQMCLRGVGQDDVFTSVFEEIVDKILENSGEDRAYLWDPTARILGEIKGIYSKIASLGKKIEIIDPKESVERLQKRIGKEFQHLRSLIENTGFEINKNSSFKYLLNYIETGDTQFLLKCSFRSMPVRKPKKSRLDEKLERALQEVEATWQRIREIVSEFARLYSVTYYTPYLWFYDHFQSIMDGVKRQHGKILIDDVNFLLNGYLSRQIIPDIYFRLGETIYHYLIDEFQDTSPIQWINLYPLIENALSQGGSLFVVGDTKQSIYGFRDADYRIMKSLEETSPFTSAEHEIRELFINYRSQETILRFSERIFNDIVPNSEYAKGAALSGLSSYRQDVPEEARGKGYVEVIEIERDDDHPREKDVLQSLIEELHQRGYRYSDIAVLTSDNYKVVQTTGWLNEKAIPFISYSSLDIRRRRITSDIISLLKFLDSPLDDLSFSTFLLSSICREPLGRHGVSVNDIHRFILNHRRLAIEDRDVQPLYISFREHFPTFWEEHLQRLFNWTGYLPLYDLLSAICADFDLFGRFPDEEATLAKLLEATLDFEGKGNNSLKDFLRAFESDADETAWTLDIPRDTDAVNVMTIHKSKGLGFPVVILLLYGERINRGFPYIVDRDGSAVVLHRINRSLTVLNQHLETLYEREIVRNQINHLNTLYVGLTRAEMEMYILAVKREKDRYPFDIMPQDDKRQRPSCDREVKTKARTEEVKLSPVHFRTDMEAILTEKRERLSYLEKKRGDFFHRVLAEIKWIDDPDLNIPLLVKRLTEQTGPPPLLESPEELIKRIIFHEDIKPYFTRKPGRTVLIEKEFVDSRGNLFRMDRIIVDPDRIIVVDFKTGKGSEQERQKYRGQILNYMRILSEIYHSRKVEGVIIYLDLLSTEKF